MTMRTLLIIAQVLSLIALATGLSFIANTTGGTLFVYTSIGPVFGGTASLIVIGAAIVVYRRRQSLFSTVVLKPGEILFRQGDPGDCAYFIQSGEVEVLRGEAGQEVVVATLGPGQYFGEMALLANEPRNATIRAVGSCALSQLGKHNFLTLLETLPATRKDILATARSRTQS